MMKLKEPHIQYIKDSFANMKSKEDLLSLLNYTKKLIFGEKAFPFETKQLNFHSNPKANSRRYYKFSIRKKSGSERIIHAPNIGLKALQKCINLILQTVYEPSLAATGFIPGKSIVDNAKVHSGNIYIYNLDLKDFFPSIDQARFWARLKYPPFNLNEKTGRIKLANILAALCFCELTVERKDKEGNWDNYVKNVLPQGAPTSPVISNIICQQLDFYLSSVAKKFNLRYTRYADDITFSSMHNVYQSDGEVIREIKRLIETHNFQINISKTRLQKQGYRQEVTGLIVNQEPNVHNSYVKQLRMWLYYWENYGYDKANELFKPHYIKDKGHVKNHNVSLVNVLAGKLEFLRMVKGQENLMYKKLSERFIKLIDQKNSDNSKNVDSDKNSVQREAVPSSLTLKHEIVAEHQKDISTADEIMKSKKNLKKDYLTPLIHNPSSLYRLLSMFENSNGLKYLTHVFDNPSEEFVREKIIKIAKEEYKGFKNDIYIPTSIKTRIHGFAFKREAAWFTRIDGQSLNIRLGWSSDLLVEWCNNPINKGKHPIEFSEFENGFINPFKQSIQVRDGQLPQIMSRIAGKALGEEFESVFTYDRSLNGVKFFTNVEAVESGLRYLIDSMKKHISIGSSVVFSANRNEVIGDSRYRVLIITNIGSKSDKVSSEDFSGGGLKEAKDRFTGLCDWSILANFEDGCYIKRILNSNNLPEIEKIDKVDGFTHMLYFLA